MTSRCNKKRSFSTKHVYSNNIEMLLCILTLTLLISLIVQCPPKVSWRLGSCKYFASYRCEEISFWTSVWTPIEILCILPLAPICFQILISLIVQCPPKVSWHLGSCKYFASYRCEEISFWTSVWTPIEIHWSKKILIASIEIKIFTFSEASTYFRWALYCDRTTACAAQN